VTDAFQARIGALEMPHSAGSTLRVLCNQLLPLDETRRVESRVWLAFLARAAVDPELAALHAPGWQELEDVLAALLARHRDHDHPDAADRADAGLLLASLDGLASGALVEPQRLEVHRLQLLIDRQLDHLLS
jgi:TetR/AcrR family transcriptional regulator, transcriptional repressor of bet genes